MPPWCGIKAAFYVLVQKRGEKEKDGAEEEEGWFFVADGQASKELSGPRGQKSGNVVSQIKFTWGLPRLVPCAMHLVHPCVR